MRRYADLIEQVYEQVTVWSSPVLERSQACHQKVLANPLFAHTQGSVSRAPIGSVLPTVPRSIVPVGPTTSVGEEPTQRTP
ncbi:unnamed protein product [Boreogadus saida]